MQATIAISMYIVLNNITAMHGFAKMIIGVFKLFKNINLLMYKKVPPMGFAPGPLASEQGPVASIPMTSRECFNFMSYTHIYGM